MVKVTKSLDKCLRRAGDNAKKRNFDTVTMEEVLLSLIKDPDAAEMMQCCEVDLSKLKKMLEECLSSNSEYLKATDNSQRAYEIKAIHMVLIWADHSAKTLGRDVVTGADYLRAIVMSPDGRDIYLDSCHNSMVILEDLGLTRSKLTTFLERNIALTYLSDSLPENLRLGLSPVMAKAALDTPEFRGKMAKLVVDTVFPNLNPDLK